MLLEFKVKNYKSIKDWQSFSLLAEGSINELKDNVVNIESFNVLTTSLIYGRNASGKSNLLNAIRTFQHLIFESSNFKVDKIISLYEPYKLDESFSNKPTEFQIDFLAKNNVRYIYEIGFSKYEIVYEILKFYPKNHPATLFERKKGFKIKYGEYFTGRKKDIEDKLYKNQLFLSKTATNKLNTLIPAYKFLSNGLFVYSFHDSSFDDMLTRVYTNRIADDKVSFFKENMNLLMKEADTGIESIEVSEENIDINSLPEEMSEQEKIDLINRFKHKIRTVHRIFKDGKEVGFTKFKLEDESTGTIKLLGIGGLILEALDDGQTLIIDELDKSLHPKLTKVLIKIFQSKRTNPKNAQLIFATHDVSLLDNTLFRRDQVWFAEKEFEGCSHYYSISDISGVRATSPYEKYYMSGRLGAIPVINENELNFQF